MAPWHEPRGHYRPSRAADTEGPRWRGWDEAVSSLCAAPPSWWCSWGRDRPGGCATGRGSGCRQLKRSSVPQTGAPPWKSAGPPCVREAAKPGRTPMGTCLPVDCRSRPAGSRLRIDVVRVGAGTGSYLDTAPQPKTTYSAHGARFRPRGAGGGHQGKHRWALRPERQRASQDRMSRVVLRVGYHGCSRCSWKCRASSSRSMSPATYRSMSAMVAGVGARSSSTA